MGTSLEDVFCLIFARWLIKKNGKKGLRLRKPDVQVKGGQRTLTSEVTTQFT